MSAKIDYSEQSYKRRINFDAKFLMIGNNIDGFVNFKEHIFENFEDLKLNLPNILMNLECWGEWDIKLYQITNPYKIIDRYGYYKVPSHGKLILTHSYMDYPIKTIHFLPTKIQIIGGLIEVVENWNAKINENFLNYEVNVEVVNIAYS